MLAEHSHFDSLSRIVPIKSNALLQITLLGK
jgi:hypothetical protein